MDKGQTLLWLQSEDGECGGCAEAVAACPSAADTPRCESPALLGEARLLRRVLDSLRDVDDPLRALNLVDARHIRALRIEEGEAELALTFAPLCGRHQQAAADAFHVLRRELPDTDVFVTHPA